MRHSRSAPAAAFHNFSSMFAWHTLNISRILPHTQQAVTLYRMLWYLVHLTLMKSTRQTNDGVAGFLMFCNSLRKPRRKCINLAFATDSLKLVVTSHYRSTVIHWGHILSGFTNLLRNKYFPCEIFNYAGIWSSRFRCTIGRSFQRANPAMLKKIIYVVSVIHMV